MNTILALLMSNQNQTKTLAYSSNLPSSSKYNLLFKFIGFSYLRLHFEARSAQFYVDYHLTVFRIISQ